MPAIVVIRAGMNLSIPPSSGFLTRSMQRFILSLHGRLKWTISLKYSMPDLYEDALHAFDLCEQFAAIHDLPVDYVWQEFTDPSISTLEEVECILLAFSQ